MPSPRLAEVRDRLPSLYRPQPGDRGLLTQFLRAVVDALEEVSVDAGDVMNAHWLPYADRALFSRFFLADRRERGLPPPNQANAEDAKELARYPHIRDLARLAAVLPLPPWQELLPPSGGEPAQRETAEAYRQRIRRIVALYRNGLGTTDALRSIVEAQLPVDLDAAAERQDRGCLDRGVRAAGRQRARRAGTRRPRRPRRAVDALHGGERGDRRRRADDPRRGPRARRGLDRRDRVAAVELFDTRVGIGYRGTVAAGRKLRLRPAASSWLGLDGGVVRSRSAPGGDPTAPGPWQLAEGGPEGTVVALLQSRDFAVWAATEHELHRFDGQTWKQVLADLPTVHCIAEDGDGLLIGTDSGLRRIEQHPEGEGAVESVAGDRGRRERAARRRRRVVDRRPRTGSLRLEGDDRGAVRADRHAGPRALPRPRRRRLRRHGARALPAPARLRPLVLVRGRRRERPGPGLAALPPRRRGRRAQLPGRRRTSSCRPCARCTAGRTRRSGSAPSTGSRATSPDRRAGSPTRPPSRRFPDLGTGPVHAIAEDARGLVWFATDRGVLRYDGRDLWQFQSESGWVQLGRADQLYGEAGVPARLVALRTRIGSVAASSDLRRSHRPGFPSRRSRARRTSRPCAAWPGRTRRSRTSLGEGDPEPVDDADLVVRYKPSETRIVDGGIPAIPRLPAGTSTWRYLALEGEETTEPERAPGVDARGTAAAAPAGPRRRAAGPLRPAAAAAGEPVRRRRVRVPARRARSIRVARAPAAQRRRAPDQAHGRRAPRAGSARPRLSGTGASTARGRQHGARGRRGDRERRY